MLRLPAHGCSESSTTFVRLLATCRHSRALVPLRLCPPGSCSATAPCARRAAHAPQTCSAAPPAPPCSATCVLQRMPLRLWVSSRYEYIVRQLTANPSASRCRCAAVSRPSGSVFPVLYYNSATIHHLPSTRRSPPLSRPSGFSQYYFCTTSQRKSLSFPRRHTRRSPLSRPSGSVLPVRHFDYKSTKIPQLAAPQYVPQSALAPLRLCRPSTTFLLQFNENPSASDTTVHGAVRFRAPPPPSIYYVCILARARKAMDPVTGSVEAHTVIANNRGKTRVFHFAGGPVPAPHMSASSDTHTTFWHPRSCRPRSAAD